MPEPESPAPELHNCSGELPTEGDSGAAIDECMESSDGSLWVFGASGVTSMVGYCPYCGYAARLLPTASMLKRIGS